MASDMAFALAAADVLGRVPARIAAASAEDFSD
jgi:hypothetical protein